MPGTPEWDDDFGRPVSGIAEWWPSGRSLTEREIEEQRLRSADYSDLEIRIHRALNRKPSWIRGPPRRR